MKKIHFLAFSVFGLTMTTLAAEASTGLGTSSMSTLCKSQYPAMAVPLGNRGDEGSDIGNMARSICANVNVYRQGFNGPPLFICPQGAAQAVYYDSSAGLCRADQGYCDYYEGDVSNKGFTVPVYWNPFPPNGTGIKNTFKCGTPPCLTNSKCGKNPF